MNRKYPQLVPNLLVYCRRNVADTTQFIPVELMSYEIIEGTKETIMARMLPGDPNTLQEVNIGDIRKLPANDRPRWVRHYEVIPQMPRLLGHVPEDMLRYDNAVPITFTMQDGESVLKPGESKFIVGRCAMAKSTTMADGRWASFGWSTNQVAVRSLKAQLLQGMFG